MTETGIDAIIDKISKIKSAGVIERYGFHEFLAFAKEVRTKVSDEVWLEVGWDILEGLGLEELSGCDYDILQDLENIPIESDLIDIQSFLRHTLVETLLEQFESGGTTVLLDIEKMLNTPAAVLIPRIIELRKKEIETTVVPLIGKMLTVYDVFMNEVGTTTYPVESIHLEDLWMTAYGFQVLSLLNLGLRTDLDGLRKIEIIMERMGMKLTVRNVQESFNNPRSNMSDAMQSLLMKRALPKPMKSKNKKSQN
ncbi:hypothetical protein E4H12_11170 [Candidatus Thorarchaeota archaeon]|nr:MAG: hypothetical protein E4H12_11170 [Candidatus Thorarchaeota archaeon]